jgi:hypothetical protein
MLSLWLLSNSSSTDARNVGLAAGLALLIFSILGKQDKPDPYKSAE